MSRPRRKPQADSTQRPEAERAFLAGLLELLTDDAAACRDAARLVEPDTLTIEWGGELLAAIIAAVELNGPTIADVARIVRERWPEADEAGGHHPALRLVVELVEASAGHGKGYRFGVRRHAGEITRAAARRRMIEAAAVAEAVAADPGATPQEIEAAARSVAEASAGVPDDRLAWEPFPTRLLPEPVRSFVTETAAGMATDEALVALPMLAALAAAIGNRRTIELSPGFQMPSLLWTAVVAASGSMKSPAANKALAFTRQRQKDAFAEYRAALADWEQRKREHDAARRSRAGAAEQLDDRPEPDRFIVDDATLEALAMILARNPAGVLQGRDELSGWLDFNRYSGSQGDAEVGRWLTIYDAGPLTSDRKLSGLTHVDAAYVSITGGIQPKVLGRVIGSRHIENGLLQRFIVAAPPQRMKTRPTGGVEFATTEDMRGMFATLYAIRPADDGGPRVLDLAPDAADRWEQFVYDEHAPEQFKASGPVKEMLSKAEGWAARLALVVHVAAQAGGDPTRGDRVTLDAIEAGIGLSRWAAREWQRVFHAMQHVAGQDDDAALRQWIAARGGVATPRDVARGFARYRAPGAAEAALRRLTTQGAAEWSVQPTGGRPADAVRVK